MRSKKAKKALLLSIEHWIRMRDYPCSVEAWEQCSEVPLADMCELCRVFCHRNNGLCEGCPVMESTGESMCQGTPYHRAFLSFWACRDAAKTSSVKSLRELHRRWQEDASEEIKFLQSLLQPNEKQPAKMKADESKK